MFIKKKVIEPNNNTKKIWDLYIIILTVYTAIELPLRFAFNYPADGLLFYMEIIVSLSFGIDIFLNFRTAYKHERKLITDPKQIARRYLKTWFIPDLLATIPFFLIPGTFGDSAKTLRIFRLFQLNRLIKLTGISKLMKTWQSSHSVNPAMFRLTFFVFFISIAAHWIACGWILIGAVDPKLTNPNEIYSIALYWSLTTLTTVGYGDLTPHTIGQRYYTMMVMIAGVGAYGYVIGNISGFLSNMDILKAGYKKRVEEVTAFLNYKSIPIDMKKRVLHYYDYLWESRLGHDESRILDDVPEPLRTDLAMYMRQDLIKKVPFFENADEALLRDLVLALRPQVYLPGSYIIKKGERGTCLFIVSNGELEVVSGDGERVYAHLGGGNFVGEMALLLDQPRTANVKTKEFCDLYILEKSDFDNILLSHPGFAEHMKEIASERLEDYKRKKEGDAQ